MTRRSGPSDPEILRVEIVDLLTDFKKQLLSENLRGKVLALIPAFRKLRDLGSSLIPKKHAAAARDRILFYFRKYPLEIIKGDELMVVAGISEWARRIRELRVQFGWRIITGVTAKEMTDVDDFELDGVDVTKMKPDEYILADDEQDRDAAFRWHRANEIRRKKMAVRDRILEFLRDNVGKYVTGEELRYVAGDKTEWARRVRELRTEFGWPIASKSNGRPNLPVGVYILEIDRQSPKHDRNIPDAIRMAVLERDQYKCTKCGWNYDKWNPSDPRHLELHHKTHHVDGGENSPENLVTFCVRCHDDVHRKEKN